MTTHRLRSALVPAVGSVLLVSAAAQVVSVPALLATMGVVLDKRGPEGAFDDGLRPSVAAQPALFNMLASVMSTGDQDQRVDAAYAFGILAGPGAPGVPPADLTPAGTVLVQMLGAPNRRTRVAGARVSGRLFTTPFSSATMTPRPAGLIEALFPLLNASDETEQLAAMDAIGRLREPTAVTALTERFTFHRERGPRRLAGGALEALARIGHPSSAPLAGTLAGDRWAERDDAPALAAAFARERLLHDGSIKRIREAADQKALRLQAQGYLEELRRP